MDRRAVLKQSRHYHVAIRLVLDPECFGKRGHYYVTLPTDKKILAVYNQCWLTGGGYDGWRVRRGTLPNPETWANHSYNRGLEAYVRLNLVSVSFGFKHSRNPHFGIVLPNIASENISITHRVFKLNSTKVATKKFNSRIGNSCEKNLRCGFPWVSW